MKVLVMGAGGVGGYYGGLLAKAGHDVTFVARGAHLQALQRNGLTVESEHQPSFTLPVRATDRPGAEHAAQLLGGTATSPSCWRNGDRLPCDVEGHRRSEHVLRGEGRNSEPKRWSRRGAEPPQDKLPRGNGPTETDAVSWAKHAWGGWAKGAHATLPRRLRVERGRGNEHGLRKGRYGIVDG